jgi:hypothetical protein
MVKLDDSLNTVFHFSEDPQIAEFVPRLHPIRIDQPAYVWAIDAAHAINYLFPRDCPRICIALAPTTTADDRDRFFHATSARRIITVESRWLSRIRAARLFAYHLPAATFETYDLSAGYVVSTVAVAPLHIEPLGDLLAELLDQGVELRFTPALGPLQQAVAASSLKFSMIRLRNAAAP